MGKKKWVYVGLSTLVAAAGWTVEPPNEPARRDPKPNLSTPGFVIDSHLHYNGNEAWEKSFLETYTKWNAMAVLLVNMNALERGMAFAKAHPDLVIPYASINIESPTVEQDIQKVYDMGYRGLGELFALREWDYDAPKYDVIWEKAQRLKLMVLFHTGIHASGKMSRMRPGPLASIAAEHPLLMIQGAHFGNPWYAEAAEVARRNPNVYFDITGSSLIKKAKEPWIWSEYLWWSDFYGWPHMPKSGVPALQKLVFATDEEPAGLEANILRFNRMLDALGADEETRRMCFYGTVAKAHKIDVSKRVKKE